MSTRPTAPDTPRSTLDLRLLALVMAGALVAAACGGDSGDDGSGGGDGDDAVSVCPVDALGRRRRTGRDHALAHLRGPHQPHPRDVDRRVQRIAGQGEGQHREPGCGLRGAAPQVPAGHPQRRPARTSGSWRTPPPSSWPTRAPIIPGGVCAEADGYTEYDDFLPGVIDFYSVDGVLQPASFNVSTVLALLQPRPLRGRRDRPRRAAGDARGGDRVRAEDQGGRDRRQAGRAQHAAVVHRVLAHRRRRGPGRQRERPGRRRHHRRRLRQRGDPSVVRRVRGDARRRSARPGSRDRGTVRPLLRHRPPDVVDDGRDLDRGDHHQRRARGQPRPGRAGTRRRAAPDRRQRRRRAVPGARRTRPGSARRRGRGT